MAMNPMRSGLAMLSILTVCAGLPAQAADLLEQQADAALRGVESKVIAWRRDIHQNPELSNREFRTSKLVAEHLRKLGFAVETGVAHTGVIGVLKGGKPGATIALRADMDALPVVEQVDVPFRSRATSTYRGETVGVMHACAHDAHTASLMGIAEAFAAMRAEIPGTVVFLFQPAEEGAPDGEEGGASLMLKERVLEKYKPAAIMGMHYTSTLHTGDIGYRSGSLMAATDSYRIVVRGRQTHGARPWLGVDPIVTAAQIVNSMQTIVSRQVNITSNPAVITVGIIKGGVRYNIVPDEVEMIGTIRTFDPAQRKDIFERMTRTVEGVAAANGATATFKVDEGGNPSLINDAELTLQAAPALQRVAGAGRVRAIPLETGGEDFAYFAQVAPIFFFFVGVTPADRALITTPSNHSPLFFVDEAAIPVGSRALAQVALTYLQSHSAAH